MTITCIEDLLLLDEGLRLVPYKDSVGIWTWGVGRNLEANHLSLDEMLFLFSHGPTKETALYLLKNDIEKVRKALSDNLDFFDDLSEVRQAALISMGFMGVDKLLEFTDTLNSLAARQYSDAAQHALDSKWAQQVHGRALRIAEMLRSNQWPNINLS